MVKKVDKYNYLKHNKIYLLGLFLFSVLFVVDYSTSTSFLYDYPETCDSFIFQVIGKYWLQGSIPYRDLYDNKGPFLYAMNALGYWITNSKTGVLLVQIPFFFANSIITFHFLQIGFNKKQSFWLSVAILLGLSLGYSGGNHGCEYALPFIMISFYLFYRWINQVKPVFSNYPLYYDYIYGITIGVCFMTRPSNALVILMIVAYIMVQYLWNKQIKRLFQCLSLIILGSLTVCLPFIIYFIAEGCFEDFFYALIISNMHYLKNTGIWESPMYLKRAVALLFGYINCLMFFFVGLLQICTDSRRKNGIIWFLMSLVCILFFIRTNCYPNYAHICLPFAVIGLLELKAVHQDLSNKKHIQVFAFILAFIPISINTFNGIYSTIKFAIRNAHPDKELYATYDDIIKSVPKEDYDSFIGYECPTEFYLRWNIKPHYRFFALQGFSSHYNQDVYEKTNQEFINGDAKWVLIDYRKGLPKEIKEVLGERYQPIKNQNTSDGLLILYKRRNL